MIQWGWKGGEEVIKMTFQTSRQQLQAELQDFRASGLDALHVLAGHEPDRCAYVVEQWSAEKTFVARLSTPALVWFNRVIDQIRGV